MVEPESLAAAHGPGSGCRINLQVIQDGRQIFRESASLAIPGNPAAPVRQLDVIGQGGVDAIRAIPMRQDWPGKVGVSEFYES